MPVNVVDEPPLKDAQVAPKPSYGPPVAETEIVHLLLGKGAQNDAENKGRVKHNPLGATARAVVTRIAAKRRPEALAAVLDENSQHHEDGGDYGDDIKQIFHDGPPTGRSVSS